MSAYGFGGMIKKLKADPKTIVFTEGTDARILEAASRLLASNFLTPILIGNEDEILEASEPGRIRRGRLQHSRRADSQSHKIRSF